MCFVFSFAVKLEETSRWLAKAAETAGEPAYLTRGVRKKAANNQPAATRR
jgi:hypothetical protein